MGDHVLNDIQLAELNVLKKLIDVFEQEHLTYYALGGTLLGAIRHHGFIPWDDDIDIGMPRRDYEKFLQIADSYLDGDVKIFTVMNGRGEYSYYYPRVVDTSIQLIRKKSESETVLHPWVDVFPLDGVPETDEELHGWYKKVKRLLKLFNLSQFEYYFYVNSPEGEASNHNRALKTLVKKILYQTKAYKLLNTKRIWRKLDALLKKYDYDSSSRLVNACGFWKLKELFPKEIYGEGKQYPFEDVLIHGPADSDFVLTQMYGDYMTPPTDKDKNHHFVTMAKESKQ